MTTFREFQDTTMKELELLMAEVLAELERAQRKFPPFNSPHEGYAVILEEIEELWDEVKANRGTTPDARAEAIQVAAMGMRYVLMIDGTALPEVRR